MDRDLLYAGQIGLVENTLDAFKSAMIGIGIAAEAILGQSTQVFGLAATPLSSSAVAGSAFAVSIGRGAIFSYQETDQNAYGVLGIDTSNLLKTGINLSATNIGITNTSPPAAGYSINYLIAAQFQEIDTNSVSLPFYNAGGSPTVNTENFTRTQRVIFSVTGGAMAATGLQNTPSAPAGSVPLYVITITNGQSVVTLGSIVVAPGAPFISNLPVLLSEVNALNNGLASEVANRTAEIGNMKNVVGVYSTTTLTSSQQGSFVEIAAGTAVTVTYPTPIGQGGAFWRIFNSSSFIQMLRTSAGIFTGPGGNNTATIALNPGQLIELTSDNASWVVSSIGSSMARYIANQAGSIPAAANTTYAVAAVSVVFPIHSKSGAFRVRGRIVTQGQTTGTGTQNFQSSLSDGSSKFFNGANWLVSSADMGDAWGFSDFFESPTTYAPGQTVTFTTSTSTFGGTAAFAISSCFFEFFVAEA